MITNELTNVNDYNFDKINSLRIASITVFDDIGQITPFIDDITDLNCGIRFNIFDDNVTVTVKYISACAMYQLSIKCNCYENENWITKLPLSNDFDELEIMQFIKTITDKLEF